MCPHSIVLCPHSIVLFASSRRTESELAAYKRNISALLTKRLEGVDATEAYDFLSGLPDMLPRVLDEAAFKKMTVQLQFGPGRGGWCGSDRASNDDAGLHGMARTGRASTLEVLE